MKTPSSNVFDLIKSMTKNEKRFFKVYASRHLKNSTIIKLYDYMERQSVFNEAEIKERVKQEPFLKYYKQLKNILYKSLLKTLDIYHYESSQRQLLRNEFSQADLLFKKGLYNQSLHQLNYVQKKATLYEDRFILAKAMMLTESVKFKLFTKEATDVSYKSVDEIRVREVLLQLQKEVEYYMADILLLKKMLIKGVGSKREVDEMALELLKLRHGSTLSNTYKGSVYPRIMTATIYYNAGFFEKSANELKMYLEEVESKFAHQILFSPGEYLSALFNYIVSLFTLKRYSEVETYVSKLKKIHNPSIQMEMEMKFIEMSSMISLYNCTGDFQKAISYVNSIFQRKILAKDRYKEYTFEAELAFAYIGEGMYKEAIKHLVKTANTRQSFRHDIALISKLLLCICYFELKKTDMVELYCNDGLKMIKSEKLNFPFVEKYFQFLQVTVSNLSSKERMAGYQKLRKALKEAETVAGIRHFFDFDSWITAKIENKKFANIVRSRYAFKPSANK